jgi:hypothetical protein
MAAADDLAHSQLGTATRHSQASKGCLGLSQNLPPKPLLRCSVRRRRKCRHKRRRTRRRNCLRKCRRICRRKLTDHAVACHDRVPMPVKRQPSEAEINALAVDLAVLWRTGDVIGPWLRKHHGKLLALVHDDWSWSALAAALTIARVTYRTGRAWSADNLRRDVWRARRPLKACLGGGTAVHAAPRAPCPEPSPPPRESGAPPPPPFRPGTLNPDIPLRTASPEEEQQYRQLHRILFGKDPP